MKRVVVSGFALLLFVVIGCNAEEPPVDEPTVVIDLPALSQQEVIANVQTLMKSLRLNSTGGSCYQLIQIDVGWANASADYLGEGVWVVGAGSFNWHYFEMTGAILSRHLSVELDLINC